MPNVVWVVGRWIADSQWELQGVCSSEEIAISMAKGKMYFIGPCEIDKALPDESCQWEGAYYPDSVEAE